MFIRGWMTSVVCSGRPASPAAHGRDAAGRLARRDAHGRRPLAHEARQLGQCSFIASVKPQMTTSFVVSSSSLLQGTALSMMKSVGKHVIETLVTGTPNAADVKAKPKATSVYCAQSMGIPGLQ